MSSAGAASRAAGPTSNARAAASRKNGARSRGPKTAAGKARSAQNALKHGSRAEKYVVLLDEDWGEFARLETALVAELAPEGALQSALARRVARAAWRLIRADRLEAEVFAVRGYAAAGPGLALIRDGNGTRSIETLIRYRASAMAEFTRALRTLKALQAEAAATVERAATPVRAAAEPAPAPARRKPGRLTRRPQIAHRSEPNGPQPQQPEPCPKPNQPERQLDDVLPDQSEPGRTLHEAPGELNANRTRGTPEFESNPNRVESCPCLERPEIRTNPRPVGGCTKPPDIRRACSQGNVARGAGPGT